MQLKIGVEEIKIIILWNGENPFSYDRKISLLLLVADWRRTCFAASAAYYSVMLKMHWGTKVIDFVQKRAYL